MPIGTFASEVLACSGIPELPAFEAIVGDSLNFTPLATIGSPTVTLVQKPSGSSASVVSNAFTCDVAGIYIVTLSNAGQSRQWTIYCFAAATLGRKVDNNPYGNTVNRGHLRGLASNAGMLAAGATSALRTALEGTTPTNLGQINWASLGN